jgi:hypothetical protein
MKSLLFSLKFAARRWLLHFPAMYLLISRLRHPPDPSFLTGAEAVSADTDLLIAGLPRTGNSFAVNAFRLAQQWPVRVAHHEYPPAQIMGAARYGVPALLIVRDPDEVAVSRVASHPPLTLKQALADYVQCYEAVRRWREHYVLATFPEIVGDFGSVIRRINDKFGTQFAEFQHTAENVQQAFDLIDDRYLSMGSDNRAFSRQVARPSREREEAKAALQEELVSAKHAALRESAQRVFRQLQQERGST